MTYRLLTTLNVAIKHTTITVSALKPIAIPVNIIKDRKIITKQMGYGIIKQKKTCAINCMLKTLKNINELYFYVVKNVDNATKYIYNRHKNNIRLGHN